MHIFTQKSIELANSFDYLDKLSNIYPIKIQPKREISLITWEKIERNYKERNDKSLFENLLELKKFPF